ncbi:MAG: hypothetical protein S4CHLAM6_11800 [Chlamydiae bacterium]|nr:hypothetical protein [Chlamydiota bacterium]
MRLMDCLSQSLANTSYIKFQDTSAVAAKKPFRLLTVPKSGTHLIEKILKKLGYNKCGPPHHIYYDKRLNFRQLDPNIGYIASVRDPRDIMVSIVYFIDSLFRSNLRGVHTPEFLVTRNKTFLVRWLNETTFDEKLKSVINQEGDKIGVNMYWLLRKQLEEAKRLMSIKPLPKNIIVVRFEDLVGVKGGGEQKKQATAINKIANHLNIKLSDEKTTEIADQIWGNTPTFRKGKIGQWKEAFKREHLEAFKANQWTKFLLAFGYETDPNWMAPYLDSSPDLNDEANVKVIG